VSRLANNGATGKKVLRSTSLGQSPPAAPMALSSANFPYCPYYRYCSELSRLLFEWSSVKKKEFFSTSSNSKYRTVHLSDE
jgi:hypothetical protein